MRRLARGGSTTISFYAASGDASTASSPTAKIRRPGQAMLQQRDPPGVALSVTARVATAQLPAGWDVTITEAVSGGLQAGTYWVDLVLTVGGRPLFVEPETIEIYESPSSPA